MCARADGDDVVCPVAPRGRRRRPPAASRSHCGLKYERILEYFTVQLTVVFTRRGLRARRLFMTAVVDKILLEISYGRTVTIHLPTSR